MAQENPFAVTRLSDPCLTKEYAAQIETFLSTVDEWLKDAVANHHVTKIKQSQKTLHAALNLLQHGLEKHQEFEKEFAHVTIDRFKRHMLNVDGKRLPLKTVPWRSGREKSQYLKDLEKKKKEAADRGRSKKKARLEARRTKTGN